MQVVLLMLRQLQGVLGMYADKRGLAVIQIVGTFAKVEIEDVDAVHLLHLFVDHPLAHMLRDGLGHAIEHPLQVVEFAALLDLHEDNPPL